MNEKTDPLLYWIIGLGFIGGYLLVSFIFNKVKSGKTDWKAHEAPPPQFILPKPGSQPPASAPPIRTPQPPDNPANQP